jgi:ABC-type multidrug transport system ATPase subunit
MITIDHLTKRYRNITAVDGLSFEVGPGRVTGFLGPNGGGKTTTAGVVVFELTRHTDNLEELFFDITSDRADDHALEVSPS